MTNNKFIKSLTESHPLAQMFIIEAIAQYADQCAVERLPERSIIDPDAWQRCAVNLKTIIENRK